MTTAPQSTRRLSALDGSFLRLDTPQSPMHVGWSAVFAAPEEVVAQALARSLVEPAKAEPKRRPSKS